MIRSRILTAAVAVGLFSAAAQAASFTSGNLAVYRVGDGASNLANTGNAVFVDEYTTTGTLVQSIPMPTTASGTNNPLVASGTATSEGLMTLSTDGRYLVLTGYGTTIPQGSSIVSGSAPRVVGRVDGGGAIDTSTALTDFSPGNNPRSAASTDGTNLWVGGAAGGVRYTITGSTTSTQLSTSVTNIRGVEIFAGQLYESDSSGTIRVGTVGSGLPTTSGQTITNLPGFPTTGSPYAFFLADLTSTVAGLDTLYVAEDTAGGGQIQKYSLVSGSWTLNGTVAAAAIRGLTGEVLGNGSAQLFGTTGASTASGGGAIYAYNDATGYNTAPGGVISTIATLSNTSLEAFRGIAFVPTAVPEPASLVILGLGACVMLRRR
jgi:hypothetical protein